MLLIKQETSATGMCDTRQKVWTGGELALECGTDDGQEMCSLFDTIAKKAAMRTSGNCCFLGSNVHVCGNKFYTQFWSKDFHYRCECHGSTMLVTTDPRCESAGLRRWRRFECCQGSRPSAGLDQSDLWTGKWGWGRETPTSRIWLCDEEDRDL